MMDILSTVEALQTKYIPSWHKHLKDSIFLTKTEQ